MAAVPLLLRSAPPFISSVALPETGPSVCAPTPLRYQVAPPLLTVMPSASPSPLAMFSVP